MTTPYAQRTPRQIVFVASVLAGGILLLMPHAVTSKLHFAFVGLLGGPLHLGQLVTLSARQPMADPWSHADALAKLQDELIQLRNQNANLMAQLQTQQRQVEQLQRCRTELDLRHMALVAATALLRQGPDRLTINRGQQDHVRPGCVVLSHNAVVGTVSQTAPRQSVVELISSERSRLEARVGNLRHTLVLAGQGQGRVKLTCAKYDDPIRIGDPIYVKASPGLLAADLLVGRVKALRRDAKQALLWDIDVEPAFDLNEIQGVSVAVDPTP